MRIILITLALATIMAKQASSEILVSQTDCKDRIFSYVVEYFNDSSHPVWFISEWANVKNFPQKKLESWLKKNESKVYNRNYSIDSAWNNHLQRLRDWNKKNEHLKSIYNSPSNKYIKCNIEVIILGQITDTDVFDLKISLQKFSNPPSIHALLASEGGSAYAAMEIGRILRDHYSLVTVGVPNFFAERLLKNYKRLVAENKIVEANATGRAFNAHANRVGCYSACSLIYAAGVSREVWGQIGIHQHFLDKDFLQKLTIKEGVKFLRKATVDIKDYFNELGVPEKFYELAASISKDDLLILGEKEMSKLFPLAQPEYAAIIPEKVLISQKAMNKVIVEVADSLDSEVNIVEFMKLVDKRRASNPELYLWNKYNSYHMTSAMDSQKFWRDR